MVQGLPETGSEVRAGSVKVESHSLVAAPLTRVCPEEFSVGSSQQSSGRCQTWVEEKTMMEVDDSTLQSNIFKSKDKPTLATSTVTCLTCKDV